jgi:glycosyltransferase involved in cell wall biosynthesis
VKFSIIVPTYNEEKDIGGTLDTLVALDYPDKEILIVDDSTDCTPEIVGRYSNKGVRLIHPGGGGRCEARNIGIMRAEGDVVCILNADVRPRPEFLTRIATHYENGADYVLVRSWVSNYQDLFARYISSFGAARYNERSHPNTMEWTEGFSCRREVAIRAGLFPVGFPVPICAGEDGFFGTGLRKSGARKVIDFSIVVDHVAPSSFDEYWRIRKGRGAGSAQCHRFLDEWSFARMVVWNALKGIRTTVYLLTLVPALVICLKAARHSPNGVSDTIPFLYAWVIEQLAFHTGEWQATFEIMKKEKELAARS